MHPRRHPFAHVIRLHRGSRLHRHLVWGGGLIAIGLAVLLEGQGLIGRAELWLVAPALLAWSAAVRLALDRSAGGVVRAIAGLALAAYLFVVVEHVGGWTFAATWPVLLIAVGVANVAHALFRHARAGDGAGEEPTW